ncbi:MAG: siroheme synthase CysG [Porticoccaceae bacterium]|nr:siroheme synthase CysG [Porticoccaceae bacterium]
MDYLPLFHDVRGRRCLVVGGGEIALRKVRPLLEAGGRVLIVAPQVCQALETMAEAGDIQLVRRAFHPNDLTGAVLVICATDDSRVNEDASRWCRERNIPVNVVDNPALCSVIFPSIIDRSPVQIAISTGGSAPVLARLLRGKIESLIPAGFGKLAALANRFRPRVKQAIEGENGRRKFWEQVFEGRIAEAVFSGNEAEAEDLLERALANQNPVNQGEVYLVGGGPGDPDLLTFRALRLMQRADIVLYDRLVSKEVLNLVRRDAERIYVGKTAGDHPVTQGNINRKLVEYARQGHRVLRLKGGDPFIFGRGGEEIEHLAEHNIAFQVVPGITAASGCASYAGIPLTHRDYAQSVRFITGHRKGDQLSLDWRQLAAPGQTLVFYMGLNSLPTISEQLMAHGLSSEMPAALIEKGTTASQRVVIGTLANLPQKVEDRKIRAPTLIIVGGVVSLHDKLNWFKGENRD